ncbi:MAG TPA: hypothetical protein VN934_03590 [Candidatus Tumulicola sp.]|nr:hypothetical protein [Candidatus Tumulicola sp.]
MTRARGCSIDEIGLIICDRCDVDSAERFWPNPSAFAQHYRRIHGQLQLPLIEGRVFKTDEEFEEFIDARQA